MAVAPEASPARPAPAAPAIAAQLFEQHAGWIYGYCLRVLRSPEEAEDALQTTYLNACRSLNEGIRPRSGSAWLLRIAQNVCSARLRASGRRGRLERVQDVTMLEETVAAPGRSRDDLIGLADALVTLPERQRNAILLREWQGLSHREVADELGLTRSAVETLIFRARRSLAAALENPGGRVRRRSLHALDLGGVLAALKGFFAGGAGVKTVAAVALAAGTATVVAADSSRVWPDRHAIPATAATESPERESGPAAREAAAARVVDPAESARRPASPAVAPGERRAGGQATAAAAKAGAGEKRARGDRRGEARAPGRPPKAAAAPNGSSAGRGSAAGRRPEPPDRGGPPPQARPGGLGQKSGKAAR